MEHPQHLYSISVGHQPEALRTIVSSCVWFYMDDEYQGILGKANHCV